MPPANGGWIGPFGRYILSAEHTRFFHLSKKINKSLIIRVCGKNGGLGLVLGECRGEGVGDIALLSPKLAG